MKNNEYVICFHDLHANTLNVLLADGWCWTAYANIGKYGNEAKTFATRGGAKNYLMKKGGRGCVVKWGNISSERAA